MLETFLKEPETVKEYAIGNLHNTLAIDGHRSLFH
uniref:Uncharacterized protein n=1 Tax=Thuretia quercifolia TaxID=189650 RepID=A0A1Z1MK80_9FLOR|nr:hypothetical protein [Thuretia quercifolia]ARW66500.1 hypothetical protein [Thuretia quercifolia]